MKENGKSLEQKIHVTKKKKIANNNILKFSAFKVIVQMQIFKEMQIKIVSLVIRRQRFKRKIPIVTQAIEKYV